MSAQEKIKKMIDTNKILLFMKGDRKFPQCGFSGMACQILDHLGAAYETNNVLEDNKIREGVKIFSNWPTIPQLYVNGEFVGGADIMREMFESGELKKLLDQVG
jgi:monothiol glutaredoxin